MDRRIALLIFYPGWTPAVDTTDWLSINCGRWSIGMVDHHVTIRHAPANPPPDAAAVLDETFAEYRRRGVPVIKLPDE